MSKYKRKYTSRASKYTESPIYKLMDTNGVTADDITEKLGLTRSTVMYHMTKLHPTQKAYDEISQAVKKTVEEFGGKFVMLPYNRPTAAELKQEKIKAIKSDKVYSDDELADYIEKHPSVSIAEISKRTNRTAQDILRLVK